MSYLLDRDPSAEFERLERQSTYPQYDYKKELALSGLSFKRGESVLDAGTGSGIVARYLAWEHGCVVTGCDLSDARVNEARDSARGIEGLRFEVQNLMDLSYDVGTFDKIFCRYVLEHIPNGGQEKAISEIFKALKPGGSACLVDIDGLFYNIYPQTPAMRRTLARLERSPSVDLKIGRKLVSLMNRVGFSEVQARIEALDFSDSRTRQLEVEMTRTRFEMTRTYWEELAGGEKAARKFIDDYLRIMSDPSSSWFYNKFVVTGVKSKKSGRMTLLK